MSVYKRGGIYWYDFWFQGERYRDSTGLSNRKAAGSVEAIRKAELAEGRAGIVNRPPCPPFEGFVTKEFLPWSEREHQAHPRTHQRYKVSAKPLREFLGKLKLDAVSSGHVEKFKLARGQIVSPAGVNRDMAALRVIMNLAIRHGYILRNPVAGVRFLAEGPGIMRTVSHEEEKRYLAKANALLRDVASLMLQTGMRPEEVFTIRKENVHLSQRYVFVPIGKTKFARRNVPLGDQTSALLKQRVTKAKGPYLFPHRNDPHRPLTSVKKAHLRALEEANIDPPFRIYDLRHTFGSRSAMAGVDLATLKELMGHSQISMTMRYVHPTPEHKQQAVRKLEQFNVDQVFASFEKLSESPHKSPHSNGATVWGGLLSC
jgi:integrase